MIYHSARVGMLEGAEQFLTWLRERPVRTFLLLILAAAGVYGVSYLQELGKQAAVAEPDERGLRDPQVKPSSGTDVQGGPVRTIVADQTTLATAPPQDPPGAPPLTDLCAFDGVVRCVPPGQCMGPSAKVLGFRSVGASENTLEHSCRQACVQRVKDEPQNYRMCGTS